jgi:hypothetical protein
VSYTLNVQLATGAISFGTATPSKTWSATAANNTFRQDVINTGTAPVTYTLGDVNTCGATIDGSTISFTKSGIVLVKATVVNDDKYNYSQTEATYVLTVNKASGHVSLTATSGKVRAGNNTVITVNNSHGGALSAAATSGATGRIESITGPDNNSFTIQTNGTASSSATITVTCGANDYYNAATATYTLTITNAIDIKKNPLYYMAERYIGDAAGTAFSSVDNGGYFFTWYDAMAKFAAQTTSYNVYKTANKTISGSSEKWHLPTETEWFSIVPGLNNANIFDFVSSGGIYKSAYIKPIWGYNADTKAGVLESSYWRKVSKSEIHAIRFLGTEYCSAWKYELIGNFTKSSYGYIRISATMIETVPNNRTSAETWYADNFSSVVWGNNPTEGAAQRILYARGYRYNGHGSGSTAEIYQGEYGYGWSTTQNPNSSNIAWAMVFCGGSKYGWHAQIHSSSFAKGYAWNVRLFRDN